MTASKLILEAKKYNIENGVVDGWIPGYKWYKGYLNRHPQVSLRTPQSISRQKRGINETQLRKWFKDVSSSFFSLVSLRNGVSMCLQFQIQDYVHEKDMDECLLSPDRIFNMDETSFRLNPYPGKVLAKRGARNVHTLSVNSDKDCYTVLLGGKYIPDYFSLSMQCSPFYSPITSLFLIHTSAF